MASNAITEILGKIDNGFDGDDVSALLKAVNAHASGSDLSGANTLNAVLDRLSSIQGTRLYARVAERLSEFEKNYGALTKQPV
jgi:hypothetical protein